MADEEFGKRFFADNSPDPSVVAFCCFTLLRCSLTLERQNNLFFRRRFFMAWWSDSSSRDRLVVIGWSR